MSETKKTINNANVTNSNNITNNPVNNNVTNNNIIECNKTNILLANAISLFHIMIILFVLIAPFTNIVALLILHVTFCLSLLVHWYTNNNICSLSVMEAKLRGLEYTDSFSHKFIGPVYDVSKTTWSTICYIITIVLMIVSIHYIYKSNKFNMIYKQCNEISEIIKQNPDNFSTYDKIKLYTNCVNNLFII